MTPYYADESVTLYHGDALEILPSLRADLILTDPPYGVGVKYGRSFDDRRSDYWAWFSEAVALMREAAPIVAFTHRVTALREVAAWDWIGVWNKPMSTGARLGNSCLLPHWEPIFMYGIHTIGTRSQFTADVFTVNPQRVAGTKGRRGREGWAAATGEEADHPTPKPEPLYGLLLRSLGQNAETVLDPFAGSGTTLRVAKDHGRKAIGIEIEERWCEAAVNRLAQSVMAFDGASA